MSSVYKLQLAPQIAVRDVTSPEPENVIVVILVLDTRQPTHVHVSDTFHYHRQIFIAL